MHLPLKRTYILKQVVRMLRSIGWSNFDTYVLVATYQWEQVAHGIVRWNLSAKTDSLEEFCFVVVFADLQNSSNRHLILIRCIRADVV